MNIRHKHVENCECKGYRFQRVYCTYNSFLCHILEFCIDGLEKKNCFKFSERQKGANYLVMQLKKSQIMINSYVVST